MLWARRAATYSRQTSIALHPLPFAGEVALRQETIPSLAATRVCGCVDQIGTNMPFEQMHAYLELFGFATTTADERLAEVHGRTCG